MLERVQIDLLYVLRAVKSGVPQRAPVAWYLQAAKAGKLALSLALIDPTIVRAHQHAAGARKKTGRKPSAAHAAG